MGKMTIYMVYSLVSEHKINIGYHKQPLSLTWADGMIGVLPIFNNREDAEKYSDGLFPIVESEVECPN